MIAFVVLIGMLVNHTVTEDADAPEEAGQSQAEPIGLVECERSPLDCNAGSAAVGGEMDWSVDGRPDAWNPMADYSGTAYQVLAGVLPHTGQWLPDGETYEHNMEVLAEQPTEVSSDPLTVRFEFNPDALWSDGTNIDAYDMAITWMMAAGDQGEHCRDCHVVRPEPYDRIEEVRVEQDGAVAEVVYAEGESDPHWRTLFGAASTPGGLYPAHIAVDEGYLQGRASAPELDDPAGVGEYFEHLADTVPRWTGGPMRITAGDDRTVELARNERWHGTNHGEHLDRVTMHFETDLERVRQDVQAGEVQAGATTDLGLMERLAHSPTEGVAAHTGPGASLDRLVVNQESEPLDDPELRRAILTAVDAQTFAEQAYGEAHPGALRAVDFAHPPGHPEEADHVSSSDLGSGNTEKALRILDEAGYDTGDTLRTPDGDEPEPLQLISPRTEELAPALEVIEEQLAEIGVEVEVASEADFTGDLVDGEFDLALHAWRQHTDHARWVEEQWHSEGTGNYIGLDDAAIDALVEEIAQAEDHEQVEGQLPELFSLVTEEAVELPLVYRPERTFVSEDYVNIRPHPYDPRGPAYNIHEWAERD